MSDLAQALEGKNVKEMLLNVGSGGGAAAAPTGGAGVAPTEVPVDEAKDEKKEEGTVYPCSDSVTLWYLRGVSFRERGVGRGHGFRVV